MDIFETWLNFLPVNITFCDAVNIVKIIHINILLNLCMSVLEIIKTNKADTERQMKYTNSGVIYQKYINHSENWQL